MLMPSWARAQCRLRKDNSLNTEFALFYQTMHNQLCEPASDDYETTDTDPPSCQPFLPSLLHDNEYITRAFTRYVYTISAENAKMLPYKINLGT